MWMRTAAARLGLAVLAVLAGMGAPAYAGTPGPAVVPDGISATDALGRTTWFVTDAAGRRVSRQLPGGGIERQVYDRSGRLVERRDFAGRVTTFAYDDAGRLVQRVPDPQSGEAVVSWGYTVDGRRSWMRDGVGETRYGYDAVSGRLATVEGPAGSLSYRYDGAGRLSSVSTGRGTTASYGYDGVGRLSSVSGAGMGAVHLGYDGAGRRSTLVLPNGIQGEWSANGRGAVSSVRWQRGGSTVWAGLYGYDAAGRRTQADESGAQAGSWSWTYDRLGRLTAEVLSAAGLGGTASYGFDAVGNRLSRSSSLARVSSQTHAYTADDHLESDGYDANGNTVRSSQGADAYTADDRLRQRTRPDGRVVTIAYDGDGVKVSETVDGVTTWFLVDQQNPTGYSQTIGVDIKGTGHHVSHLPTVT